MPLSEGEKEFIAGAGAVSFAALAKSLGARGRSARALRRIRAAPCGRISDLRSLLEDCDDGGGRLVVVRCSAICKPALLVRNAKPSAVQKTDLVSTSFISSGIEDVLVESASRPQHYEWLHHSRGILLKDKVCRVSEELIPIALVDVNQRDSVTVVKTRPLPRHLHPVQFSSSEFISTDDGHEYSVAMWNRERPSPIVKEITAVGICRIRNGSLEILSSRELPYFLSNMTKDEIEAELKISAENYFWCAVILGAITTSMFGYAMFRLS